MSLALLCFVGQSLSISSSSTDVSPADFHPFGASMLILWQAECWVGWPTGADGPPHCGACQWPSCTTRSLGRDRHHSLEELPEKDMFNPISQMKKQRPRSSWPICTRLLFSVTIKDTQRMNIGTQGPSIKLGLHSVQSSDHLKSTMGMCCSSSPSLVPHPLSK